MMKIRKQLNNIAYICTLILKLNDMLENLLNGIKAAGFTKIGFGAIAIGFAVMGMWNFFFAFLGIFIYINANTIYKALNGIKL